MTDLDLLRVAARELGGKEKVAYDPTAVAREAISSSAGRAGYDVLTENVPKAVGGAVGGVLGTAGRVAAYPFRAVTGALGSAGASAGGGLLRAAGNVGRSIAGEALHIARKNPVGAGLAAGFTYMLPPHLARPAGQASGFSDDIARLAHGIPSSPVQWG